MSPFFAVASRRGRDSRGALGRGAGDICRPGEQSMYLLFFSYFKTIFLSHSQSNFILTDCWLSYFPVLFILSGEPVKNSMFKFLPSESEEILQEQRLMVSTLLSFYS